METSELCYISADDAIAAFGTKKLSPVELMQAVIDQSEKVQASLNAFTYTYFDEAMDFAKAAEARYAKGAPMGPLDGLPIGIKDESYIAGKPTSFGSLIMKDFVPDTTSVNNERILAAGGIAHARTATPEFSCAGVTWSRLWGVTRNPWNPEYTPGGSSGGSASSLASGTSTLAMGSDIGGSIRIPASTCGLVGYKPPYGRNTDDPPFNLDFFCHTGPLARTVKDAIRIQNVICGPSPRDIASLRPKLVLPTEYGSIKGWKIAYSPDLGAFEVDPEVRKNTESALQVFRDLGATVEEVDVGWNPSILQGCLDYLNHLFGGYLSTMLLENGDDMTTYCRALCEMAMESTPQDFVRSLDVIGKMYNTLGPLLDDYNVLICPTTALPAVAADFDPSMQRVEINGKEVDAGLGWVMTTPFNAMSRCPVLTVPSGQAANGVPTGIQIVGRTYCDEDVFQAAIAYEAALGGWFNGASARPRLLETDSK
jgi:Asp-tRNA(Asn)/Glu-tRNA(Gln) amidotransferase A subunit family amidase